LKREKMDKREKYHGGLKENKEETDERDNELA
jgi:hypothetical protein